MPVDVSRLSTCAGDPHCRRYTPIRCEAAVIVPDVIHVLLQEHDQMRRLCADVRQAGDTDKKGLFAELYQLVNVHELGDLAVVQHTKSGTSFRYCADTYRPNAYT
jgi:hypothetical protein